MVLGIYPKVRKLTFTEMFISLFIILENQGGNRCPSVAGLGYIQIMEYYSVLKRNELSSHKKTRRKLPVGDYLVKEASLKGCISS